MLHDRPPSNWSDVAISDRLPTEFLGFEFDFCVFAAKSAGGARSGGGGRKTTARAGTKKSAAARAKAHVRRSTAAGAGNVSPGAPRTVRQPAPSARTQRGPGGAPKEVGRGQSSAGKGRPPAPKRAK